MTWIVATDWNRRTLGDCAKWLSGGTPSKSRPEYWGGSIPWISARSLDNFFISNSDLTVTELGVSNGTRLVEKDTILFIVRGMSLKTEFRMGVTQRPVTFNQDIKALVAVSDVDPHFLAYAIRSQTPTILGLVDEAGHGTGRLSTDLLQALEIPIPPLDEQRRIAAVLGALDDKIELNRKMNRTLEAMAQAIFKSRFIDFDGHDPDDMVESELGPIPKGWEVGYLAGCMELAYGKALPEKVRRQGPVPVYGSGGISGTHDVALVSGPGVVVGRKGSVGTVYWEDRDFFPIDTTFYVVAEPTWLPWCYLTLATMDIARLGADSAVPGVNRNTLLAQRQAIPPAAEVEGFVALFQPLRARVQSLLTESRTLAALRDALLPKLISGEIRVPVSPAFDGDLG